MREDLDQLDNALCHSSRGVTSSRKMVFFFMFLRGAKEFFFFFFFCFVVRSFLKVGNSRLCTRAAGCPII